MKANLLLLVFLSQIACNKGVLPLGKYYNTKYYIDAPINTLSLGEGQTFSLMYPNVIGEKELGVWEIKNDTLILHVKFNLINNFQDTLFKNGKSIYKFLIKGKSLYSTTNMWVLKRK